MTLDPIAANYRLILSRLAAAAQRVGRSPHLVQVLGASKTVAVDRIRQAVAAGLRRFGENYLQEAKPKIAALAQEQISWHFIGHLQSNKAREAVRYFDLIHSVDRPSLATALEQAAAKIGKIQDILLEINLAGEASKSGAPPTEAADLLHHCLGLPHLRVVGLMALPPWDPDPEASRPYFRALRQLRDRLQQQFPGTSLPELSMGMSADYEVAVEEGATLVRLGTALFGPRPAKT